jgi:hypothetical protein
MKKKFLRQVLTVLLRLAWKFQSCFSLLSAGFTGLAEKCFVFFLKGESVSKMLVSKVMNLFKVHWMHV